jgi:hypothetical protein
VRKFFKSRRSVIIGAILALMGFALPTVTYVCQAQAVAKMSSHLCCKQAKGCGLQFTKAPCCQVRENANEPHAVIVSNHSDETFRVLPVFLSYNFDFSRPRLAFGIPNLALADFSPPGLYLLNSALLC